MTVSQSAFDAAVFDPAAPVPDGLRDPTGANAGRRFAVYRNNVAVGLTEALQTAFPVIRKLVGDAFFHAMAGVYLRNHPPKSPVMMFYGADMPGFLKGFEPVAHLPYLPDVARLELALRHAYHAADAAPVAATDLGLLEPADFARARLGFAPAVRLLSSRFAIHGIWLANSDPAGPPPQKRAEDVLITRRGYDPKPHYVPRATALFFAALMEGKTLTAATTAAGRGLDLSAALALLFSEGAIISIR